jgi:hypothetical protein
MTREAESAEPRLRKGSAAERRASVRQEVCDGLDAGNLRHAKQDD